MSGDSKLSTDIRKAPLDESMVRRMAGWPTLPARYQGKPADIHAAVIVGHELGVPPMEALNSLYMVDGKVSMSGKLMSALVHRAGHMLKIEIKPTETTVFALRRDPVSQELVDVGSVTFTQEDAERANLHTKPVYESFPSVMRTWRAISQACRFHFADCLSGVAYIPEEVGIDDSGVEPIPLDDLDVQVVEDVDMELENNAANVAEVLDAEEV